MVHVWGTSQGNLYYAKGQFKDGCTALQVAAAVLTASSMMRCDYYTSFSSCISRFIRATSVRMALYHSSRLTCCPCPRTLACYKQGSSTISDGTHLGSAVTPNITLNLVEVIIDHNHRSFPII